MKVRWAVVVLIIAIIVMATGCSANSDDPTVTGNETVAVTTTEPAIGSSSESTAAPATETPLVTTPASTEPAPLPDPDWFEFSVGDLAFDESGTLWASGHLERGDEGLRDLYRLDGTQWQIVENSRVFSPPIRWELRAAPGGGVFVGADDGVYRTDGENWELFEEEFACGSLAVDSTGVLWATCPDFLTRLAEGAWEDVPEGWAAQSVATGADGSVWFTTFTWPGFELLRFDGVGWTSIAPCEDCYGPRSILGVDETGGAWVARGECGLDGLTRFDPSGSSEEFDIRGAGDLAFGPDGSMWFAIPCTQTMGDGGVGRYLDGEWRLYTTDDGLPSNNVQAVETAPDGTIVIGTDRGVSTYDPETDMMSMSLPQQTANWPRSETPDFTIEAAPEFVGQELEDVPDGYVAMGSVYTEGHTRSDRPRVLLLSDNLVLAGQLPDNEDDYPLIVSDGFRLATDSSDVWLRIQCQPFSDGTGPTPGVGSVAVMWAASDGEEIALQLWDYDPVGELFIELDPTTYEYGSCISPERGRK
jgi:hypothetical protein